MGRAASGTLVPAFCLLVFVLAGALPARSDEAALERAREFLDAGRLYPAEQAAREATEASPDDARGHALLGRILLRRQQPREALDSLERARQLDPGLPGIDRTLGDAWLLLGENASACEAYTRAVAADGDDAPAHLRRAECAEEQGDLALAEASLLAASRNPDYEQLALYRLGGVRARAGKRDAAREAYERAAFLDPPSPLAARAWAAMEALDAPSRSRSWSLSAAAGLVFDDNVTQPEVDVSTGDADQAGQFEVDGTWQPPLPRALREQQLGLELGYAFYQTLYFDTEDLDLQSHSMSATLDRPLGPGNATFSYLYSLNTLGGDRFLDLQDIRPTYGIAPHPLWYATFGPALQIKRFEDIPERDALAGFLGTLQLFDLSGGNWSRYLLLGGDVELEDADGREFDARGVSAQAALYWSLELGEYVVPLDLRYRYRLRDYDHDTTLVPATATDPAVTTSRRDSIHSASARASWDVHRFATPGIDVALDLEYAFEDATSDLPSADYTQNVVTLLLRFAL